MRNRFTCLRSWVDAQATALRRAERQTPRDSHIGDLTIKTLKAPDALQQSRTGGSSA